MNYKRLKDLVPLYVNGTISEKDKITLEKAADKDPKLKKEIEEFSKIELIYDFMEIPEPPHDIYENIVKNIERDKNGKKDNGFFKRIKNLLKMPNISWSLAFAEFLLIVFLFGYTNKDLFVTSSNTHNNDCRVKIDVVFKKTVTLKQFQSLLRKVDGYITYGPGINEVYFVCIKKKQPYKNIKKRLTSSGYVEIVTKGYWEK